MTNPIIAIDADTAAEAVALLSAARRVQLILSCVTTVAQLEQADALLAAIERAGEGKETSHGFA